MGEHSENDGCFSGQKEDRTPEALKQKTLKIPKGGRRCILAHIRCVKREMRLAKKDPRLGASVDDIINTCKQSWDLLSYVRDPLHIA